MLSLCLRVKNRLREHLNEYRTFDSKCMIIVKLRELGVI